jgi:hypothetical protein
MAGTDIIKPMILGSAISRDHAQVLRWLCDKELSITAAIVEAAVSNHRFEIIKVIHPIDSFSPCSEAIA